MSNQSKLERILNRHLVVLIPIYSDHDPRRPPYTYFLDVSLFRREYAALLSTEMLTWHLQTSRFSQELSTKHGRRLIRRIVPIARQDYSEDEIRLIKYSLHFQLALGIEVLVMFVDPDFLPESEFGTDNLVLVKSRVLISSPRPYDPQQPEELVITPGTRSDVADLYLYLESLKKGGEVCSIRYNEATFTAYDVSDLKRRYGWLLYSIQSGRCALSVQSLDLAEWDVDHIFPRAMGGNNSLVNLQAGRRMANIEKGARIQDLRYALSPQELLKQGLKTTFHRRLSDRKLVGIPLGPDSLHYLDPKVL